MILSIDVGIRNLALCLLDDKNNNLVRNWDVDGIPPEDMSAEAFESLRDSMDRLADDLQNAADKGASTLAARLARRRAKGDKESRMHGTVADEVAAAVAGAREGRVLG